jgi:type IV pilus assembly protein PilW
MNTPLFFFRPRGFSLIELMVSIVVGMLAIMFATKLVISSEQNKNASIGGSDSMQNGMLAMFSISKDAGQAGWGLNDPLIAGCDTLMIDNDGFQLATVSRGGATAQPLAAAVIVPGATATAPDTLYLYSGTSMSGSGNVRLNNSVAVGGTSLVAGAPTYGFNPGDVVVLAPETVGTQCSVAQVTANDVVLSTLTIATGTGDSNRFNGSGLKLGYGGSLSRVFDLGPGDALSLHAWSVKNGFLQLQASDMGVAAGNATTVADNIVSIKAEYGFDTRAAANFAPANGMVIGQWSRQMIDADADGVVGGAGDYQRVAALRIAVIARSKNPDKPNAAGTCAAGAALTVFGSAEPTGVAAASIVLNPADLAVTGDTISPTCYHYRAFETIVPLRNTGWRPSE